MKSVVIILILMIAGFTEGYSQMDTTKGVTFERGLNWQDVLQKAKAENKYIFVECYASWCGPCRWMDQHVYLNDTVGNIVNKEFLSVKLQMDSTKQDAEVIKACYGVASDFEKRYHVNAYPSYLFFSPEGIAIHEEVGAMPAQGFLEMTQRAIDPGKEYYVLLAKYQQGHLAYEVMPYLSDAAQKLRNDSLASTIAKYYMDSYLEKLPDQTLWAKENIQFVDKYGKIIIHSGDLIFRKYFKARKEIDSIIGIPGYADGLINFVIYRENIKPKINAAIKDSIEPHWTSIEKVIKRKYSHYYAEKNVVKGHVEYYRSCKRWEAYAKYLVKEVEIADVKKWPQGGPAIVALNNDAFEVFKYSKNEGELKEALTWVDEAISMDQNPGATEMDTRANLLYKLGRKEEALILEERAHHLNPSDNDIEGALKKMQNGQPTWE